MLRERIGANIRACRKRQRLSGARLARAVGYNSNTLLRIERGERGISIAKLEKIAAALGTTPAALLEGEPEHETV